MIWLSLHVLIRKSTSVNKTTMNNFIDDRCVIITFELMIYMGYVVHYGPNYCNSGMFLVFMSQKPAILTCRIFKNALSLQCKKCYYNTNCCYHNSIKLIKQSTVTLLRSKSDRTIYNCS